MPSGSATTSPRVAIRPARVAPSRASAYARTRVGSRRIEKMSSPWESSSRGTQIPARVVRRTRSSSATQPAVVLMDINLPGISGIEATRRIVAASPATVVVLMSTYDAGSLPSEAADCGAARYVHKEDFSPSVLREVWDATAS